MRALVMQGVAIKPVEGEGQEQDARKGNGRMRSLAGLAFYMRGTVLVVR